MIARSSRRFVLPAVVHALEHVGLRGDGSDHVLQQSELVVVGLDVGHVGRFLANALEI